MPSRRILIMSAGSGPCNNLMRSLLHDDDSTVLIGCHSDRFVLKQSRGRRNFLLPPADSAGFDWALRRIIAGAKVDLVAPGNDRDVLLLAQMQEHAPIPCRLFLPSVKTIALCQDKYALNVLLRDRGVRWRARILSLIALRWQQPGALLHRAIWCGAAFAAAARRGAQP